MLRFRSARANWQSRFLLSSATIAASTLLLSATAQANPTITSVTATDQTSALYADFINEPNAPPNVIPGLPGTEWNDNDWSELNAGRPTVNGKSGIAAKSTGSKTSDTSFTATHNFVKRARAGSRAINLRLWTTPKFTATANVEATGGWIATINVEAGSQIYRYNNKTEASASDVTTTIVGGTVVSGQNGNLSIATSNTTNGSYKPVAGSKTFTVRGVGNAALQVTMSQQFKLRMGAGDSVLVWDPGDSGRGCVFGGMSLSKSLSDIDCTAPNNGVSSPFGFKVTGTIQADTDSDGIPDDQDNCPTINNIDQKDTDGDGAGDLCDPTPTGDSDGDGADNSTDNCPTIANPTQADWNFDGVGDACDDSDGDGFNDDVDNCRSLANPDQADLDVDGVGDACDPDIDGDGIMNHVDNCKLVPNTSQADWNQNGVGDVCEDSDGDGVNDDQDLCPQDSNNNCLANPGGDFDGDGHNNGSDNCPTTANPDQDDIDGNGVGDVCDDSDGDGYDDAHDNCPLIANPNQADWNQNGVGDACDDSDGDGIPDDQDLCREDKDNNCPANPGGDYDGDGHNNGSDNCPLVANPDQADWNQNGIGDACEDSDGDGVNDETDVCPADKDDNCVDNPNGDFDGDGHNNGSDNCPMIANPAQDDWNQNGVGDACEDSDGDGVNDDKDLCPTDAANNCIDNPGGDFDGDGHNNGSDNCPLIANPDQADWNQNGIGDACEDSDGDGVNDDTDVCPADKDDNCLNNPGGDFDGDGKDNGSDNCPDVANTDQADWNNNGIGDACEDSDGDGVKDDTDVCPADKDDNCLNNPGGDFDGDGKDNGSDNCPDVANSDQADWNNNGVGDACDDSDNDGITDDKDLCPQDPLNNCLNNPGGDFDGDGKDNGSDNCPDIANADQADWNNNGVGDACEDSDGDGVNDDQDVCPADRDDNCVENPDADTDGDGVNNGDDNCPLHANADQADTDGDGIGDACDPVTDGDDGQDADPGVLMRSWGQLPQDIFGSSLAAGDVNGDGYIDVVVGAYKWTKPQVGTFKRIKGVGRVYAYSGKNGLLLRTLDGENKNDWFGHAVAVADVDGDGAADIIVGAPKADASRMLKDTGKLYVYSGKTGELLTSKYGSVRGEQFGARVTSLSGAAGTYIAAAAPRAKVFNLAQAGYVDVVSYDAANKALVAVNRIQGKARAERLGEVMAPFADISGDDYPELAVGLPKLANGGKVKAGIVRIYRTDVDTSAALLHTIDGAKIPAARKGDLFGSSIAAVADMDGDNVPELLIGAPRFDATIAGKKAANSGAAFVVASSSLGADMTVLSRYYGEAKGDQLGWAVADGQQVSPGVNYHFVSARGADTTIKHPSKLKQIKAKDAGAVYGWRVGEQQWSKRLHGKAPKAYYGNILINAGDFNGDGYRDVISASAFMSRVSSINRKWVKNTGFVEVYSGEMIANEPR